LAFRPQQHVRQDRQGALPVGDSVREIEAPEKLVLVDLEVHHKLLGRVRSIHAVRILIKKDLIRRSRRDCGLVDNSYSPTEKPSRNLWVTRGDRYARTGENVVRGGIQRLPTGCSTGWGTPTPARPR